MKKGIIFLFSIFTLSCKEQNASFFEKDLIKDKNLTIVEMKAIRGSLSDHKTYVVGLKVFEQIEGNMNKLENFDSKDDFDSLIYKEALLNLIVILDKNNLDTIAIDGIKKKFFLNEMIGIKRKEIDLAKDDSERVHIENELKLLLKLQKSVDTQTNISKQHKSHKVATEKSNAKDSPLLNETIEIDKHKQLLTRKKDKASQIELDKDKEFFTGKKKSSKAIERFSKKDTIKVDY